jgi:hypothetical protein
LGQGLREGGGACADIIPQDLRLDGEDYMDEMETKEEDAAFSIPIPSRFGMLVWMRRRREEGTMRKTMKLRLV